MNTSTLRTLVFSTSCICASPVLAQGSTESLPESECARTAKAAEIGAKLRDQGSDREAVKEGLRKVGFSDTEGRMGSTAAFTYVDLREFAMSDFVESYCRVVVGNSGNPPEFAMMMIKNQYDLSVRCAKSGRVLKKEFLECWNEQVGRLPQPPASAAK